MSQDNASGKGFTMKDGKETAARPDGVDFSTFVFSLATGAFIQMGLAPDPLTGKTEKHLDLARQNIDILLLLKEKTRGNLSPDETKLIESLAAETQLRFVEVSAKK
ncbi:DUF1844 domain-containing protein [bacterium]|nr:DUF1844 domain-containing protein [bacterium]